MLDKYVFTARLVHYKNIQVFIMKDYIMSGKTYT